MSEIQFLQAKSDVGSMIFVSGSITSSAATIVISYTPINGTTFVLVSASAVCNSISSAALGGGILEIRNNTSVREYLNVTSGSISGGTPFTITSKTSGTTKGDTLIGDGTKTYDVYQLTAFGTGDIVYASIMGYLE